MSEMKHSMFLYRLYAYAIYGHHLSLQCHAEILRGAKKYPIFSIEITCFSQMVFVYYLDVGVDFISGRRHVHFLHGQFNFKYRIF